MTDLLLVELDQPMFTWGRYKLEDEGPARIKYINALRDADKRDYSALAKFVRS